MTATKFSAVVLFSILSVCFANLTNAEPPCGDWETYNNELCFKVFESAGLQTFENAEKNCQQSGATLIRIHYPEEQTFLTNFLFTKSKVVDNVWIGAKFSASKFKWDDSSELTFTNWAKDHPKNVDGNCVQMHSDSDSVGKWVDEPCLRKNLVVCQKKPILGIDKLQEILLEVKQSLIDTQKELKKEQSENIFFKEEIKKNLAAVKQESVPIGLIYVQLPNEKPPTEIWHSMAWTDVSATYAGVFFRVLGQNAASFGEVQSENSPRLSKIKSTSIANNINRELNEISLGSFTAEIFTGINGPRDEANQLQFLISGGEVRPRNMAIRIWKRTG